MIKDIIRGLIAVLIIVAIAALLRFLGQSIQCSRVSPLVAQIQSDGAAPVESLLVRVRGKTVEIDKDISTKLLDTFKGRSNGLFILSTTDGIGESYTIILRMRNGCDHQMGMFYKASEGVANLVFPLPLFESEPIYLGAIITNADVRRYFALLATNGIKKGTGPQYGREKND